MAKKNIDSTVKLILDQLSRQDGLGYAPSKVEIIDSFMEEPNFYYRVFKFKTSFFSKWYLGISCNANCLTEMAQFPADKAEQLAAVQNLKNKMLEKYPHQLPKKVDDTTPCCLQEHRYDEKWNENIFVFSGPFHAGKIVDRLNELGINSTVEWEDDGDVGMKSGGICSGKDFSYPTAFSSWGSCMYFVQFIYEDTKYILGVPKFKGNGEPIEVSVKCPKEKAESLIELFGWERTPKN